MRSSFLAYQRQVHQDEVDDWDDSERADLDNRRCGAIARPHPIAHEEHGAENENDTDILR